MGAIPPPFPTLYTLSRIYDTGSRFLGARPQPPGLPRTYEEYVWQLYGRKPGQKWPWYR